MVDIRQHCLMDLTAVRGRGWRLPVPTYIDRSISDSVSNKKGLLLFNVLCPAGDFKGLEIIEASRHEYQMLWDQVYNQST